MTDVEYKFLYFDVCRQNAELAAMVDKYQNEIIPQYYKLLEKARAERDAKTQEVTELKTELVKRYVELDAALEQLKKYTECRTCKTEANLLEWHGYEETDE